MVGREAKGETESFIIFIRFVVSMKVRENLVSKLSRSQDYVALATVNADAYAEVNSEIIYYLTEVRKTPGVYVTLNKPFEAIKSFLQSKEVNINMLMFIDAVTKTAGGSTEKTDRCLFIGNPENLTDIAMAMDQAVRAIPAKERFLFFDSLSTLLVYNKPVMVVKFIHFLAGKMRVWKVKGIIISLMRESDKELIDQLMQFCDIKLEL